MLLPGAGRGALKAEGLNLAARGSGEYERGVSLGGIQGSSPGFFLKSMYPRMHSSHFKSIFFIFYKLNFK